MGRKSNNLSVRVQRTETMKGLPYSMVKSDEFILWHGRRVVAIGNRKIDMPIQSLGLETITTE